LRNITGSLRAVLAVIGFFSLSACVLFAADRCDPPDPRYDDWVGHQHYSEALALIFDRLNFAPDERQKFRLDPLLSLQVPDVHGQSDPDSQTTRIDPALLQEGESDACQGVLHEREHLRQFAADRRALMAYYAHHAAQPAEWQGCDEDPGRDPVAAAYGCLEDNQLRAHEAADEIGAVLAQRQSGGALSPEDAAYLLAALRRFDQARPTLKATSNEGYYLPGLKANDARLFCLGVLDRKEAGERVPKTWAASCAGATGL